jgi:phenylpyruvate tautomerase PptA (4-oxalocrotonate tautomerase family)
MITVDYPKRALSQGQKDELAEEMTRILLEIEGGADTPEGRSIAWVRFREIAPMDWYIGGTTDAKYVSAAGKFLIELNVPEGSMNQAQKSDAHRAINDAFLHVTGSADKNGAGRSVWVQIFEWPRTSGDRRANRKYARNCQADRQGSGPPGIRFFAGLFRRQGSLVRRAWFSEGGLRSGADPLLSQPARRTGLIHGRFGCMGRR